MTVNMCKYMNGEENNSIIDMMIHNLKKYGNLIQPCPIKVSKNTIVLYHGMWMVWCRC